VEEIATNSMNEPDEGMNMVVFNAERLLKAGSPKRTSSSKALPVTLHSLFRYGTDV
jgi:hypothetical protein